jgi:hypothetical protein
MATFQVGQRQWDDLSFDRKPKQEREEKKNNFLKFSKDPSGNQIRILSDAFEYLTHAGWKPEGDSIDASKVQKWGYNIKCSQVGKGTKCPCCEAGNKPIRKWYFLVLDRSDNTTKIMDVKRSVVQGIKPLTQQKVYGHPSRYDIIVTVNENADPQHYYAVTPLPPEPLSLSDLKLKEEFDMDILHKLVEVPTYEKTRETMDKIIGFVSTEKPSTGAAQTASPASAAPATTTEPEFTFQRVQDA